MNKALAQFIQACRIVPHSKNYLKRHLVNCLFVLIAYFFSDHLKKVEKSFYSEMFYFFPRKTKYNN